MRMMSEHVEGAKDFQSVDFYDDRNQRNESRLRIRRMNVN